MAEIDVTLIGSTPLVMHNQRLADPEDEIAKKIKEETAKRTKTTEIHQLIARYEWQGGLYIDNNGAIAVPTANVRKCLIQAAKVSKQGKQVERAVVFADFTAGLVHDGPKDIDKLSGRPEFRLRTTVVVGQKRVVRTRPKFPTWMLSARIILLDDMLNFTDLQAITSLAGRIEGLGDARTLGFGRFTAELRRVA